IDGQPAVVLEISKRTGANIIATVDAVNAMLAQAESRLPETLDVSVIMDQSTDVENMLDELLNNVLTAVVLVLIVILATMGPRSALLVGTTIPGAFLTGILLIWAVGYTLNIVVLFALILVAGMLVDGAIVVGEQAERFLAEGLTPHDAWAGAASRMAWPVISSTATTLVVFLPLLFWPGVVGEFMKYLPATVILCLLASLAMALVFLPTLGNLFSRRRTTQSDAISAGGRLYRRSLASLLRHPGLTLAGALLVMALIYMGYARFNHGVEFFPSVEPDSAQVLVHARGDLSVDEKDAIVQRVEARLDGMSEIEALYARSFAVPNEQLGVDVIGQLTFQLIDWDQRRPAGEILADMAERTEGIPGIQLEFREQEQGPTSGKPIQIELSGDDPAAIERAVEQLRAA
ncbi:efflux RND transporter permease subunit, partial [Halomonas sp. BBD48]|nr:efflux RND transporter permease subunit [Halomonas sp. BBD48]